MAPLLSGIRSAKKSVEITIFRFDRPDIEEALKAAVSNGVRVAALIARANRGGEESLRKLEMRFLEAGIIVARTADDLIRYHDKLVIIDRRILYMLSFNFTRQDIDRSRGFGIVTKNVKWVQEAVKLVRADFTRQPYKPGQDTFVVSPANARTVLSGFLQQAKKQLLIYDPKISDKEMIRILRDRAKAGVEIRIIGRIDQGAHLGLSKPSPIRLHTRMIIRDRHLAFVGSQSLRSAELDSRREVGLIVRNAKVVRGLIATFESDWASKASAKDQDRGKAQEAPLEKPPAIPKEEAERAARVLVQELDPLTTTVKKAVKKVVAKAGEKVLKDKGVKDTMKKIVKKAVKQAVKEAVQDSEEAKNRI
ncbi:MAG TPA: phospholipase D-like domain-containing protein [Candidatus Acidoferrales bacterium]|nr:phospholipase D-like domain-containing protein [Candidatus Acidoferrales bacterium]